MDKEYLQKQYHLSVLEYKTAHTEDAQWQARISGCTVNSPGKRTYHREDKTRKKEGLSVTFFFYA